MSEVPLCPKTERRYPNPEQEEEATEEAPEAKEEDAEKVSPLTPNALPRNPESDTQRSEI